MAEKTMKAQRERDGEKKRKRAVILGLMKNCNRVTHGRSSKI